MWKTLQSAVRRSIAISVALVASLASATTLHAATITVTSGADAGGACPGTSCTLRQAIASATAGDTIDFAPNLATVTLTSGELAIAKNLTIAGPGANLLTVARSYDQDTPAFRVVHILPGSFEVTFSGLTIANGDAGAEDGGGVLIESGGTITFDRCAIAQNRARSIGGGIYNLGNPAAGNTVNIRYSTIRGNVAGPTGGFAKGGGIKNTHGSVSIVNSTFSGNSALSSAFAWGGAIENSPPDDNISAGPSVSIVNSTVAFNASTGNGGGIASSPVYASLAVRSTIVAKNTAPHQGPDVADESFSQGYNLIGNSDGAFDTGPTDVLNVDPLLGPLQYNGGPTMTHALQTGSPAIDKGSSGGNALDQRGRFRPVDTPVGPNASGGDGSDIGAYEVQADQLPGCGVPIVTNNGDSGPGSLRGVLAVMCGGETITFAGGVVSPITLTDSELPIARSVTIRGPGANLMTVRRSPAGGTPDFRIFNIAPGVNATISGLTISNGSLFEQPGDQPGAGILVQSGAQLQLFAVTVSGNNTYAEGGGLANGGTLSVSASTISNNGSYYCGGGITNGGTLNVINSTIAANGSEYGGGGLCNHTTANLTSTTIAGNVAGGQGASGGGIANQSGTTSLRNTIVAKNTADSEGGGPDIIGTVTSLGYNLIGNNADATITPVQFTDQIGIPAAPIDPKLGPLQNYGGPTPTMALFEGSPALDKGHSSGALKDQRGAPRPADLPAIANATGGDGADIGAFEHDFAHLDVDADGAYHAATDGLLIQRFLFGLSGPYLSYGALGPLAKRTAPDDIATFVEFYRSALDVDGNGVTDPLTDGVMLIRYLFGLRGAALTAGVIGASATRNTAEIETYIQSLMP